MRCHSPQAIGGGFANAAAPSRHSNPFATCWTRPGAIAFHFDAGQSAEQLIAKLADQQWRGAIVGPHGSGKSTLLETLKPALCAAGFHVNSITLQNGERHLSADFLSRVNHRPKLFIIDGYEQLGWYDRAKLKRICGRAGHGLLVTSHSQTSLPTLIHLAPNERLVQQLVAQLSAQVSTPVTVADVAASLACHGSNVREILFDLYDRHERLRRAERTLCAPPA
jgi:hypothetical protein